MTKEAEALAAAYAEADHWKQYYAAERTVRLAAERENDRLTNANAALINDTVQMGMARDDAECRLVEMAEAMRELLEACEADCGLPSEGDEDDEAVGASEEGPMALTFGMLRRARVTIEHVKPKVEERV